MIDLTTLKRVAKTKGITNLGFAEKDYFQDILLLAVSREAPHLVFKGGTALYKFHGLDRFSEDLDFVGRASPQDVRRLAGYIEDFGYPVEAESKGVTGGTLASFAVKAFLYQGTPASMARIRMDLSWKDEGAPASEWRPHFPMYSDVPSFRVQVMTIEEMFAEKVRALLVRSKARDAYDVWFMLRKGVAMERKTLGRKLSVYGAKLDSKSLDAALEAAAGRWEAEVGPMLANLPDYEVVSAELRIGLTPVGRP